MYRMYHSMNNAPTAGYRNIILNLLGVNSGDQSTLSLYISSCSRYSARYTSYCCL